MALVGVMRCTANTLCFLNMLTCVCVRSKAWLAARVSVHVSPLLGQGAPRRLRAMLAAAPILFVHAFVPYHMEKVYRVGGVTACTHTLLRLRLLRSLVLPQNARYIALTAV